MNSRLVRPRVYSRLVLTAAMAVVLAVISAVGDGSLAPVAAEQTEQDTVVYFPLINRHDPWPSPFGIETRRPLEGVLVEREEKLGSDWLRRHMVSWREIQPNEGDPYDWTVLASFENELRAIRRAGTTPIVIVHHSPRWATVTFPVPPYNFAQTDCSAIRADKFDAFAAFMQALVQRYSQPEFNVHYWELGNEPDVDPRLVDQDQVFGCWGEIEDPFYGGEHYGEMLKVVTPAIKAVDPQAKVLIGGLLLDSPDTPYPYLGKPELFLKGILEAGAAPFFDILPYHAYPAYTGVDVDQDNAQGFQWDAWGGWTLGKARYLRDLMAPYGVDKPLWINEIALGCNPGWYTCDPPTPQFFEAQASFVARTLTRDLSEDIRVFTWYSLDGPGWRNTGLLNWAQDPRQAYIAYQHLGHRLSGSEFEEIVADYGPEVEAYSFVAAAKRIHVVWSIDTTPNEILVPKSEFRAAYDRDGAILEPTPVGDDYSLSAGFAPIYIELKR